MKPTIYITGNDSLPEEQYRSQLQRAENEIRKALPHAAIVNPLKLGIPKSWNEQEVLQLRLKVMKSCNVTVFGEGWIKGPLAKQEYWQANRDNKEVFLEKQINLLVIEYGHLVN